MDISGKKIRVRVEDVTPASQRYGKRSPSPKPRRGHSFVGPHLALWRPHESSPSTDARRPPHSIWRPHESDPDPDAPGPSRGRHPQPNSSSAREPAPRPWHHRPDIPNIAANELRQHKGWPHRDASPRKRQRAPSPGRPTPFGAIVAGEAQETTESDEDDGTPRVTYEGKRARIAKRLRALERETEVDQWVRGRDFEVHNIVDRHNEHIPVSSRDFSVSIYAQRGNNSYEDFFYMYTSILEAARRVIMDGIPPGYMGQLVLLNRGIAPGAVSTELLPVEQLRFSQILDQLAAIIHSNDSVELDDTSFQLIVMPQDQRGVETARSRHVPGHWKPGRRKQFFGAHCPGIGKRALLDSSQWASKRSSLHDPLKGHGKKRAAAWRNYCVPLAIADAQRIHSHGRTKDWSSWHLDGGHERVAIARHLARSSGCTPDRLAGPFTLEESGRMADIFTRENPTYEVCPHPSHVGCRGIESRCVPDMLLHGGGRACEESRVLQRPTEDGPLPLRRALLRHYQPPRLLWRERRLSELLEELRLRAAHLQQGQLPQVQQDGLPQHSGQLGRRPRALHGLPEVHANPGVSTRPRRVRPLCGAEAVPGMRSQSGLGHL